MHILIILTIAVTLSMDTFSLSLIYGTLSLSKKNILLLSIVVGIFHFIMPLIGLNFGNIILNYIRISPNTIIFMVFLIIGVQMIIESKKETKILPCTGIVEMIFFGLAVSIDSFSVGIGFKAITNKYIISSLFFSIISFIFTYLGLKLGKRLNILIGKLSILLGGIVLIILSFLYLFNIL